MRLFRKALILAVLTGALTFLAIVGFSLLVPQNTGAPDQADIIVVLGAGMDPDGRLHRSSNDRVDRGVALYKSGAAPRMHFTGGMGQPLGPGAGTQMAARAMSQGVPQSAISHEDRSQSTLQNALFSQSDLKDAARLLLVTEGFHLPRSWLSFKWAAWTSGTAPPQITLAFSNRVRSTSHGSRFPQITMPLRETLAFWFNAARVAAFEIGGALNVARQERAAWLE